MIKKNVSVPGSQSGRPIMVLLDLLGRRWCLRVLWELQGGGKTFRELQSLCGDVSPTVLNTRLRELRQAGLVEHVHPGGYHLTDTARELSTQLLEISRWADQWAKGTRAAAKTRRGEPGLDGEQVPE